MFSLWIEQIRPKTLLVSIAPVILATSFASVHQAQINIFNLALCTFCILSMQIISNLVNDYVDTKKNTDSPLRQGIHRPIHRGLISHTQLKWTIINLTICSLTAGILLSFITNLTLLLIGICSMLIAYGYTTGKYSFSYLGLGEIVVFLVFGPLATEILYYVQTLSLSYNLLIASISIGSISTGILLVNNIRDYQTDKKNQKNTLIVYITPLGGKILYFITVSVVPNTIMLFFIQKQHSSQYILSLPIWLFICNVSLLMSYLVFREKILQKYNPLLTATAVFLLMYSLLLAFIVMMIYA